MPARDSKRDAKLVKALVSCVALSRSLLRKHDIVLLCKNTIFRAPPPAQCIPNARNMFRYVENDFIYAIYLTNNHFCCCAASFSWHACQPFSLAVYVGVCDPSLIYLRRHRVFLRKHGHSVRVFRSIHFTVRHSAQAVELCEHARTSRSPLGSKRRSQDPPCLRYVRPHFQRVCSTPVNAYPRVCRVKAVSLVCLSIFFALRLSMNVFGGIYCRMAR